MAKKKIELTDTTGYTEPTTFEEWVSIHGEPEYLGESTPSYTKGIRIEDCTDNDEPIDTSDIIMEDKNGNEGYVLCNYNSCKNNMQQTITVSFKENVTKAMIYQGADEGWKTVDVANQQLTITLATGAGAFVLPSQLN